MKYLNLTFFALFSLPFFVFSQRCKGGGTIHSYEFPHKIEIGDCPNNPIEKEGWNLIIQDEFDSTHLDSNRWNISFYNEELSSPDSLTSMEAKNVRQKNGMCEIWTTKKEPLKYKIGEIKTFSNLQWGNPNHNYAILPNSYTEIKCKMPEGNGTGAAFWLYANCPIYREIDIFEMVRKKKKPIYTFKSTTIYAKNPRGGCGETPCLLYFSDYVKPRKKNKDKIELDKEFFVYGIEWRDDSIKFYLNNVLFRAEKNTHFDAPLFLRLGTVSPIGDKLDESSPDSAVFLIDYVRVYSLKNKAISLPTNVNICKQTTDYVSVTYYPDAIYEWTSDGSFLFENADTHIVKDNTASIAISFLSNTPPHQSYNLNLKVHFPQGYIEEKNIPIKLIEPTLEAPKIVLADLGGSCLKKAVIEKQQYAQYFWSVDSGQTWINTQDNPNWGAFAAGDSGEIWGYASFNWSCRTATGKLSYNIPISEKCDNPDLWIYPNPNNGNFRLASPLIKDKVKIRIIDAMGQTYYEWEGEARNQVDISLLWRPQAGLYFVEVIGNEYILKGKICIKYFSTLALALFVGAAASSSKTFNVGRGIPTVNVTQQTGYITVNGTYERGSHLYYWLFESQQQPTTDLVIWLSGGPGCSSILALMSENGPLHFNPGDAAGSEPKLNPYAWNKRANLLYIDQPAGTGFSYADHIEDMCTDEDCVGKQLSTFMGEFFAQYPQYSQNTISIFCESYGGHYCPAFAAALFDVNRKAGREVFKLKNVGIGDGLVNGAQQYRAYANFAGQFGALNEVEWLAANITADACVEAIKLAPSVVSLATCNAYMEAMLAAISAKNGFATNPYNVHVQCGDSALCYDFSAATAYLNRPDIQALIGVRAGYTWTSCSTEVHLALLTDWMRNMEVRIPTMLSAGINFWVYSGTYDFIVNYLGSISWTNQLQWGGASAFAAAPTCPWRVNGAVAGSVRKAKVGGTLAMIEVFAAGHLVPMDKPLQALSMLDTILSGGNFPSC